MKVLVCMQHNLTPDQIAGLGQYDEIVLLKDIDPELFMDLCNTPSTKKELHKLACKLSRIANESVNDFRIYDGVVLPIGSPAFMFIFARLFAIVAQSSHMPVVLFSHSERASVDLVQTDGSILKQSIFIHVKWIELAY